MQPERAWRASRLPRVPVIIVLVAISACGGSTAGGGSTPAATAAARATVTPSGPPKAVDPCRLVLPTDAQAVLGQDPGPPDSSHTQRNGIDTYQCAYARGGSDHTVLVTVKVPLTKAAFDSERATLAGHFQLSAVAGLGQEAYSYGSASSSISLGDVTFLSGQYEVVLVAYVAGTAPTDIVSRLTNVARLAMGRLP